MKFRTLLRSTLLALAWLIPAASHAQDCKPLRLLNTVKMEPIQNGSAMLVPVTVNGTPLRLLLDTGGYTTQLFKSTVDALHLEPEKSRMTTVDAEGNLSSSLVTIKDFVLGGLSGSNFKIQVFPSSNIGNGPTAFDGILSSDLLLDYDVDMDFGNNVLNLFSSDHCPGDVLYWSPGTSVTVPIEMEDQSHISVAVLLDGKPLNAILDTGATISVMRAPLAQRLFDLNGISPGDVPISAVNNRSVLQGYTHTFSSLSIGKALFTTPHVAILDSTANADQADISDEIRQRFLRRQEEDLVLGMEVLKRLHVYIATAEKKLYFSAAGPLVEPPVAPGLPAAPVWLPSSPGALPAAPQPIP